MKKITIYLLAILFMCGCSKYNNMQIREVTNACHMNNDEEACYFAAKSYENGKYESKRNRYSLAHLYYSKACELGNKKACKKRDLIFEKAVKEPVN